MLEEDELDDEDEEELDDEEDDELEPDEDDAPAAAASFFGASFFGASVDDDVDRESLR